MCFCADDAVRRRSKSMKLQSLRHAWPEYDRTETDLDEGLGT